MKELFVSVILPIYKVEKYIHQCMDTILKQDYERMEIILVDDGSPDNCPSICDEYARRDSRIKAIHKKNGGLVSAWKCGLENSSVEAEYVAFVDPDDWISDGYIRALVEAQSKTDADVVAAAFVRAKLGGLELCRNVVTPKTYTGNACSEELYPVLLNTGNFEERGIHMSRWGKLIRKQILMSNLQYVSSTTTYSEDVSIMLPVLLDARTIAVIDDERCLYYYRYNPDSMAIAYDRNMLRSVENTRSALLKACDDKGVPQLKDQVYANYLAASVQYFKNELMNPEGFACARKNIRAYVQKESVQYAIEHVEWKHYRKLNVIIIRAMRSYKWLNEFCVTGMLYCLKQLRIKRYRKISNRSNG